MNRDLRFARADRRPFHEHIEAVFSPTGQRHATQASLHVRFDPSGGFLRAGSYFQPAPAVRALREAMVAREDRFLRIADSLEEAGCGLTAQRALKGMPRGFADQREGPLAEHLKRIDPVAELGLRREAWRGTGVVDETLAFAERARSWLLFLREAQAQGRVVG